MNEELEKREEEKEGSIFVVKGFTKIRISGR